MKISSRVHAYMKRVAHCRSQDDIGKGKHARKGTTYNPDEIKMLPPTESEQQHALDILKSFGLNSKIGG